MMNQLIENLHSKESVIIEDTVVLDLGRYTALVKKEVELSILEEALSSPSDFVAVEVLGYIRAARDKGVKL